MDDQLLDILISLASELPTLAIVLFFHFQYRKDTENRLTRKDTIIDNLLEREKTLTDKAIEKILG